MPASFNIESASGSYSVHIERGSFERMLREFSGSAVIADEFFRPRFEAASTEAFFLEAVETNKSLEASPDLIGRMRAAGATRQTKLVAVGGGIVQDISAFIASVYMRGLEWVYVPTTVLAMVDSCIGGKSSINVGPYKNLVGTFHPPLAIHVDPDLVATLPEDQRASGLIEAAKICFCKGEAAFEQYLSFHPSTGMSAEALEGVITTSLQSKKWFIEIDEFDRKERLLLNFGHTFGHAMEGATHFGIAHGIAVGLGIVCALEFERAAGVDYSGTPRVARLQQHLDEMIRSSAGVAEQLRAMPLDDVLDRVRSDKKHGKDFYTLILVAANGDVELRRLPKTPETLDRVRAAIERMIERYA